MSGLLIQRGSPKDISMHFDTFTGLSVGHTPGRKHLPRFFPVQPLAGAPMKTKYVDAYDYLGPGGVPVPPMGALRTGAFVSTILFAAIILRAVLPVPLQAKMWAPQLK